MNRLLKGNEKDSNLAHRKQAFDREQRLSRLLVSPNNYSSFRSSLVPGLLGGFVGALAMGILVPLPDALCLALASYMLREVGGNVFLLAWLLHEITGGIIGAIFGTAVSRIHGVGDKFFGRDLALGFATGLIVWAVFFMPSILALMPSLLSGKLIVTSFAAHIVFGLVLGGIVQVRSLLKYNLAQRRFH